jgi:hypothetical protein
LSLVVAVGVVIKPAHITVAVEAQAGSVQVLEYL